MDQISFHHNSVLSDVHLLLPNAQHLMTRLNQVGQPGKYMSYSSVLLCVIPFLVLVLELEL